MNLKELAFLKIHINYHFYDKTRQPRNVTIILPIKYTTTFQKLLTNKALKLKFIYQLFNNFWFAKLQDIKQTI